MLELFQNEVGLKCLYCGAEALLYGVDAYNNKPTVLEYPWCTEKCEESLAQFWPEDGYDD